MTETQLLDGLVELNEHDPDAIVQVGTNLAMARLAGERSGGLKNQLLRSTRQPIGTQCVPMVWMILLKALVRFLLTSVSFRKVILKLKQGKRRSLHKREISCFDTVLTRAFKSSKLNWTSYFFYIRKTKRHAVAPSAVFWKCVRGRLSTL